MVGLLSILAITVARSQPDSKPPADVAPIPHSELIEPGPAGTLTRSHEMQILDLRRRVEALEKEANHRDD